MENLNCGWQKRSGKKDDGDLGEDGYGHGLIVNGPILAAVPTLITQLVGWYSTTSKVWVAYLIPRQKPLNLLPFCLKSSTINILNK